MLDDNTSFDDTESDQAKTVQADHGRRPYSYRPIITSFMILVLSGLMMQAVFQFQPEKTVTETSQIRNLLNSQLRFHLVIDMAISLPDLEPINPETELILIEPGLVGRPGIFYKLEKKPALLGSSIQKASVEKCDMGDAVINISFDSAGTEMFAELTRDNVGRALAVVFKDQVITAPIIQDQISGGVAQLRGPRVKIILNGLTQVCQ